MNTIGPIRLINHILLSILYFLLRRLLIHLKSHRTTTPKARIRQIIAPNTPDAFHASMPPRMPAAINDPHITDAIMNLTVSGIFLLLATSASALNIFILYKFYNQFTKNISSVLIKTANISAVC